MRVRHGILALRGFTDTNGIHYHSPCLTSLSPRLDGLFFVDAHRIVKRLDRTHLATYLLTGF
jgi:hypothetical protein